MADDRELSVLECFLDGHKDGIVKDNLLPCFSLEMLAVASARLRATNRFLRNVFVHSNVSVVDYQSVSVQNIRFLDVFLMLGSAGLQNIKLEVDTFHPRRRQSYRNDVSSLVRSHWFAAGRDPLCAPFIDPAVRPGNSFLDIETKKMRDLDLREFESATDLAGFLSKWNSRLQELHLVHQIVMPPAQQFGAPSTHEPIQWTSIKSFSALGCAFPNPRAFFNILYVSSLQELYLAQLDNNVIEAIEFSRFKHLKVLCVWLSNDYGEVGNDVVDQLGSISTLEELFLNMDAWDLLGLTGLTKLKKFGLQWSVLPEDEKDNLEERRSTFDNLGSLSSSSKFLTHLNIANSSASHLGVALEHLRRADFSYALLERLTELSTCAQLEYLNFPGCRWLEDISALGNCARLSHLNLQHAVSVGDVSALGNCAQLTFLDLSGGRMVDISALSNCTKLTYLSLCQCGNVNEISALGQCVLLEHLSLSGIDENTNLTPISDLVNLEELSLVGLRLEARANTGIFDKLINLRFLDISRVANDVFVPCAKFEHLSNLKTIRCVDTLLHGPDGLLANGVVLEWKLSQHLQPFYSSGLNVYPKKFLNKFMHVQPCGCGGCKSILAGELSYEIEKNQCPHWLIWSDTEIRPL